MQITTAPDFFVDPIGFIQFYWVQILPYVILVVTLLILMVIYLGVTRVMKSSLGAIGMGPQSATGIVMILRLVFFVIAVLILVSAFEANLATILSISAIFGTALGLAFSQALGNIVSGLYVLAARPFSVGDYVRIGAVEGIVREITLNYTRVLLSDETIQLVPNNKVVGSEVTNFLVEVDELIKAKEEEVQEAKEEERAHSYIKKIDGAVDRLKEMVDDDEDAYRYTFDLTIHMGFNHLEMRKHFDKVCTKYETIFFSRPSYIIWAKPNAGVTYRFAFIVEDPMVIIQKSSEFMDDLLELYMKGK
jgi:hypothetical protein